MEVLAALTFALALVLMTFGVPAVFMSFFAAVFASF